MGLLEQQLSNGLLNQDPLRAVTSNRNMLAQALKSRQTTPRNALTGQGLLDTAAIGLSPVPVIGDILGLGADANRFINEPESRTPLNFGLAALGLIPFVPPLVSAGLGKFAQSQGKQLAAPSMIGQGKNEAGIIGYHGTHQPDIEQFDRLAGPARRQGMQSINEVGAWFSANPETARKFGPNVLERDVQFKNPLVTNDINELVRKWSFSQKDGIVGANAPIDARFGKGDPEKFRKYLSDRGYDGVIVKGGEYGDDYYISLDPANQVKKTK